MKIKKIQIKNGYKRFSNLTIDLSENPKRIIALVGANGCGKSSVFDAMLYMQNNQIPLGDKGTKGDNYHSMNGLPYNQSNIVIDFVGKSYRELLNEKKPLKKEGTIFSFRSPYRYNQSLKIMQSKALSEISLNDYGASATLDLDAKMDQNYLRTNIKYRNYIESVDCKPSEGKEKIIGDINKSLKECLNLEITNLGDIEAGKGTLYFKKPDHSKEFEFDVLSSGEKEVVDILLDLYLRKEEYNDTIFIIDEPELHINTSIQKKLLIEINKLIGINCQIWIATHSIGFLRALQEDLKNECDIIFFPNLNYASEEILLKPMVKSRSKWLEIFATPLDDMVGLVSPKTIIYCEGKIKNSLDEKMLNDIFSEKYPDCLFIAASNASESAKYSMIALSILNKAFDKVKFINLVDRDDGQNASKKTDIDRRCLKKRELENYLYDWEIFSIAFPDVLKTDYDNIIVDIDNNDVKSKTNELMDISKQSDCKIFKLKLVEQVMTATKVYQDLEAIIFS